MGKKTDQGTRWETEVVDSFADFGAVATRLPKTGTKDEADVRVRLWSDATPSDTIPLVAWKRLVRKGDAQRRSPDGERAVIVLSLEDFRHLCMMIDANVEFYVQAKARQNLNVTRTLAGLRTWLLRKDET